MSGFLPRPFSPTDAKRDREEQARLAERSAGALHLQSGRTVALVGATRGALEAADAEIAAAAAATEQARVELAAALASSDAAQATLAADMTTLQGTTLPALNSDLDAATGRLTTAEGEIDAAFGQLGTVDTRIGTAKTEAITTANSATAYSLNPSFDDWTGASPAYQSTYVTAPTKETLRVRRGLYSARFACTDTATARGLDWNGVLSHAPNLEYWTVELDFWLESGSSLAGAGILLDWVGMTNNRAVLSLAAEVPAPVTGKWYSLTKTLRRPTNAAGIWTRMDGFLMGQYSSLLGGTAIKDLIIDWLNVRPATAEEITAYGAPALVVTAKTEAIDAAALDATAKANAAEAAAAATAAADATAKANAAEAAAISAAAVTAQTKADAAAAEAKRQLDMALASGANLILNGGFESTDVWSTNSVQVYDTAEKRTGTRSMRLTPSAGNVWPTNAWIDSATGRTYRIEFWIKRAGAVNVAAAVAAVVQAKTIAGGTATPIVYPNPQIGSLAISDTTYTKITIDHTVTTADAVQIRIAPWVKLANGNQYWVDDVTAYDITEAKTALDAANQAIADASAASGAAGAAQSKADAALNAATHTGKNLFSTAVPTGAAPYGTIWMQKGTGDVIIGQWQQTGGSAPNATTGLGGVDGSTWTKRDIDNQMIANLDVGKLTANTAAVNALVAQKIATSTAAIQQADIGNLTVTGTSKLTDLVAQQVAADSGKFVSLAVSQLTAGTASMAVGVIDKLYADVVNSRKITAGQLEAEMVLSTKIIAGNATGTRAEMNSDGFRVFAAGVDGGGATEVVRLGVASSNDYFAVTKADNTLAASVSQDGVGSFAQVFAKDGMTYRGTELQALLDQRPRGIVAAAYRDTYSTVNAIPSASIPFLRLEAPMQPGRIYKVWTSEIKAGLDVNAGALIGIKYAVGSIATMSSGSLTEGYIWDDLATVGLSELVTVGSATTVSFLIWMGSVGGAGGFRPWAGQPVRLVVEDIGPMTNNISNGVHMNGTAAPAAAKNSYIRQYPITNSMNYLGNNNQYVYDLGHMYQGLQPGTSNGNLKSIGIAGGNTTDGASIASDLAGATVNYVNVNFYFPHWYYNSGGTARIGVHNHSVIPGVFSQTIADAAVSSGWPKPGARWVALPSSTYAGFKDGSHRGLTLLGDSTLTTYGFADRPTIEIGYTK